MQAEHWRGGGFIVSPLLPVSKDKRENCTLRHTARRKILESSLCVPNSHKILRRKKAVKAHSKPLLLKWLKNQFIEALNSSSFIRKRIISMALSASVAVSSVYGFYSFFTIGTAIYHNNEIIAFAAEEKDYYSALSAAKSYAEEQSVFIKDDSFTLLPVLTLRSNISTCSTLKDRLLLSLSSFAEACTLYSGSTAVFNAESEEVAKEVVSEYIASYSMNGEADVSSTLTYKHAILPKEHISSKEECISLLGESKDVPVVSVVSTSFQKEIPFETQTHNDSTLYIGETVTVTEGKNGSAEVESETVYKNGAEQSSRILSENVIINPVTRVVRIGTKTKDVLQSGLFYPLTGTISSYFGQRWGRNHEGIDIAVPEGTPVKAAECGTVSFAGDGGTYGKLVKIDHGNGVVTAYAHLNKINVTVGQAVNSDTQIALSGNTGRSTGPHLHFEIVENDVPLDPINFLKKRNS